VKLVHLPFFSESECLEIIDYIDKKEIYLKEHYENEKNNVSNTNSVFENLSTNLYYKYNFFKDNPQYIPRLQKILSDKFPRLKYPLIIQSWGNVYKKNQGIFWHDHSYTSSIKISGLTSNIFIGGDENIGITYAFPHDKIPKYNYVNVKNKLGHIQFVENSIKHMVSSNKSDQNRYTVGVTVTEFDIRYSDSFIIDMFSENSESLLVIPKRHRNRTLIKHF